MGTKKNLWTRNEMIEQIKLCGESIAKNADSILGDEKYFTDLTVQFTIKRLKDEEPMIMIQRNFIPNGLIDTYEKQEGKHAK